MAVRVLRLADDGTELAEFPADTSDGAASAGRIAALGPDGTLDPSLLPKDYHVHVQGVPSSSWHAVHGLGRHPSAAVVDSAGDSWLADVRHVDANGSPSVNECFIDFSFAFSGTATLR